MGTDVIVNGKRLKGEALVCFESDQDTWEFLYRVILDKGEQTVHVGRIRYSVFLEELGPLKDGKQETRWIKTGPPVGIGA